MCKAVGGECIKLTFLVGIPDRLALLPGAKAVFMETKTAVNDLSPMQEWWQKKLRGIGFVCECVRSKEHAAELLGITDATI